MKKYLLIVLFSSVFNVIQAQQDSLQVQKLDEVEITATKIKESKEKLPLAISFQNFSQSQDSRQQLSFNDYLLDIPGVFALNANNFSQDLRVSIRGFGARSAFGIRGVKLIVDGIPETTPDGQGQIDNLNLGAIKSIEVVRGPSSLLYGNASGGVILINTIDDVEEKVSIGVTTGAFGMQQYQVNAGFRLNKTKFILQSNHTQTDGYRDFSAFESTNANLRVFHDFSSRSKLNIQLNYTNSPFAQDAGSLDSDSVEEDRRQARQRNIDFDTKETISQFKIGANYFNKISNKVRFNTYGFYANRDFDAKLPFDFGGAIKLDRSYFGHGSSINYRTSKEKRENTLQVGYEFGFQNDERQRFFNEEGTIGAQTLDQDEIFNSYGFYVIDHLSIGNLLLRGGLRYDRNTLEAKDLFLSNGDDSDQINLNAFNYSLGINYKLGLHQFIFGGISTSFETPALSELSNNPNGEGGFNQDLEPQEAINYEIGYKWKCDKTSFEGVLFYIDTKNDLVPFELEAFPDRDFFRNAGSTIRRGVELFLSQKFSEKFQFSTSYTYSDFKYGDYIINEVNLSGKLLPAIPKHRISLNTQYQSKNGWYMQLQGQHVGSLYTNDDNSVKDNAYTVIGVRFKKSIQLKSISLHPFFGINNLLDETYNDNVRINAFGGRFFEPGAGINMYGGLRLKI